MGEDYTCDEDQTNTARNKAVSDWELMCEQAVIHWRRLS
jgi:hypothetical protein